MGSCKRLKTLIEWAGMSTHAFGMKIGMKRSENLYRIMRNEENVSLKLATLIIKTYPQINKNWLIYGEGEMLVEETDPVKECDKIPYYSTFEGDNVEVLKNDKPTFNMYIPIFKGVDIAITMNDRSMEPIIPFGSIMILRENSSDIILFGQIYYIVCENISMVRVVRKSLSSDDEIILEVSNNNKYDDIIISKNEIKKMYLICGTVNRFF